MIIDERCGVVVKQDLSEQDLKDFIEASKTNDELADFSFIQYVEIKPHVRKVVTF